ncbi:hypothetical protein DFA_00909 [Cavenderia fasciculata]|uniref:Uncharacterized protein n=1 Tax=Cavenderia fasciculata TaxID=261658 RepID=F4PUG7_CACFS|nr:uncharacterized protein DFA_00909 [Cavenderia fasciculata]EGG21039.1 hypothetical protein DFA_00909 [Cavenderia fasciculata]|eukprot:XP_004358889.1 hypothetical protein DFA_00909 [Cavenderia fasciculata]
MSIYNKPVAHGVASTANQQSAAADDDDWETDSDYVNDVTELEQRRGSKLIVPPSDSVVDLKELRERVFQQDTEVLRQEYDSKKQLYGGERAEKSIKH